MASQFQQKRTTLQMLFVSGVLVLLPPALAFLSFGLIYNFVENYIGGAVAAGIRHVLPAAWLHGILNQGHVPGLSLVITVVTICAIGWLAHYKLGQLGLKVFHIIFERIPGIRVVYNSTRKLVETLADPAKKSWKKVVFFEGPFPGSRIFGFLTGEFIDSGSGVQYAAVACVHAPLPTSGFIVWMPVAQLTESDLSIEEALQLNASMGVVGPAQFKICGGPPSISDANGNEPLARPSDDGAETAD